MSFLNLYQHVSKCAGFIMACRLICSQNLLYGDHKNVLCFHCRSCGRAQAQIPAVFSIAIYTCYTFSVFINELHSNREK